MNVIDHETASWFLVQHGDALLLVVHCSHSFVSYAVLYRPRPSQSATGRASARGPSAAR